MSNIKLCPNCGAKVDLNALSCPSCNMRFSQQRERPQGQRPSQGQYQRGGVPQAEYPPQGESGRPRVQAQFYGPEDGQGGGKTPPQGAAYRFDAVTETSVSDKKGVVALLLALFFGYLGLHRFYTGYVGLAILQLLTAGGCGIWALVDIIMLVMGKFKDADGKVVVI